jgi:hypothetical protein
VCAAAGSSVAGCLDSGMWLCFGVVAGVQRKKTDGWKKVEYLLLQFNTSASGPNTVFRVRNGILQTIGKL